MQVEGQEKRRIYVSATLLSTTSVGELYCYEDDHAPSGRIDRKETTPPPSPLPEAERGSQSP